MASDNGAVAKDLTAGTFAGVAQLLVGHPFDTIKVLYVNAFASMLSKSLDRVKGMANVHVMRVVVNSMPS